MLHLSGDAGSLHALRQHATHLVLLDLVAHLKDHESLVGAIGATKSSAQRLSE